MLALVLGVGDDLAQLGLDVVRLDRLAAKAGKDAGGTVDVATLDEVARGLGEEEKSDTEDESPRELDRDRDAVGASVRAVLDRVVDTAVCARSESVHEIEKLSTHAARRSPIVMQNW